MKYCKEKIEECAAWVRVHGLMDYGGAKLMDFCKAMDIDSETYYNWMRNSEFSENIKNAKMIFRDTQEERLVDSLMQSAVGYEATESRTEYVAGPNGEKKVKKQSVTKKHVQPNTGAAIFLLTNIAPDKWKNKLNTEHSGLVEGGIKFVIENEDDKKAIEQLIDR